MTSRRFCSSPGHVDRAALSELPPAGLLCHPGLWEAEDHGGELRLQRDPEGNAELISFSRLAGSCSSDERSDQWSLSIGFLLLQHINELSMKLNIEEILQKAEGIYLQICSCKVGVKFSSPLCDPGHHGNATPRDLRLFIEAITTKYQFCTETIQVIDECRLFWACLSINN